MNDSTPLIELKKLRRVYTTEVIETHALGGIDLVIRRGDYVSVEGPSGCGKSTLLTILGLLDEATSGEYLLAGVRVAEIDAEERARLRNREIGFVFQSYNLIPEMSVTENVGLPLRYRKGTNTRERGRAIARALERVGMTQRAEHRPTELSGGQQQRVAVARALVGNPSLILADEPTGNLDKASGDQLMDLLDELHADGTTLVIVTHNPGYAARATRRIRMLDGYLTNSDSTVSALGGD